LSSQDRDQFRFAPTTDIRARISAGDPAPALRRQADIA
jgi:hypothetical protein